MRRSPLKPPTLEQVIAYEIKQRAKRKPLPKTGRKARREADAWAACKQAVLARSGGWCEARWPGVCVPYRHYGDHAHHIWPEDRDRGLHEPERCLWACAASHRQIHAMPAEASSLGLLRPVD